MNANPLVLLDLLLGDLVSPRIRRILHGVVLLVLSVAGIWLAAGGDWQEAVAAFLVAAYAAQNKANTPATDLAEPGDDEPDEVDPEDDLTYEDLGGLPFGAGADESGLYGDGADRGRYDVRQDPLSGL